MKMNKLYINANPRFLQAIEKEDEKEDELEYYPNLEWFRLFHAVLV